MTQITDHCLMLNC